MNEKKYDIFLVIMSIFAIAFLPFIIELFLSGIIGFLYGMLLLDFLLIIGCLEVVIHDR